MHFGENQLSRSLIGLSPLPTTHPRSFQPTWVRASTTSYHRFTLAMGRSPRFGSRTCHYYTPLGFGFPTATPHGLTSRHAADSQAHSSKGTPSATKEPLTDCKHMVSGTISLPSRGTFHHSLTVLSTIGQYKYLGLPGGPGRFTADSTSPLLLGQPNNQYALAFNYRTLTFSGRPFQAFSSNQHINQQRSGSYVTSSAHNTAHTTPTKYHMHTV